MKPEKKKSQRELAILYKIPQFAVSRLNQNGVNIYDKAEVRKAILKQAKRPAAWTSGCPWDEKPEADPSTDIDIEDLDMDKLRKDLLNAGDYDEARFIKTKIEGLKGFLQLSILERDHIPREEVREDMLRIAAGVKTGIKRLRGDLPAILEGLTAPKMKGKIDIKGNEILRLLADETSELYQQGEIDED